MAERRDGVKLTKMTDKLKIGDYVLVASHNLPHARCRRDTKTGSTRVQAFRGVLTGLPESMGGGLVGEGWVTVQELPPGPQYHQPAAIEAVTRWHR